MTTPEFTPEQSARLAAIEAAEPAPESVVERVARAMHEANIEDDSWDLLHESDRAWYRRLARAAIAALAGPDTAAAAVRRVEALAEELDGHGRALVERPDQMPAFHGRQVVMLTAAIRNALRGESR